MSHAAQLSISLSVSSPLSGGDAGFEAFRAALSAYICERASLPAVRRKLLECVAASHDRAVSMLHYLRAANAAGLVDDAAMRILADDIRAAMDAADGLAPAGLPARRKPLLGGRFEIRRCIGVGGIGEVYLADDLWHSGAGNRQVAIKIIQRRYARCQDAIRSLQREAVNAQCLVHPGIRRVFELDRDPIGQRFFLVMAWLNGETLAARLDRTKGRPMALDTFRTMLQQIGAALAFAHRHGIVHGDIKPGNVFVTTEGSIKLLDFGHAEGTLSAAHSQPFALTRGYSSLEVHRGAPPELRDDIYSLAVMAYRMLVGRRPFGRNTAVDVDARRLRPGRPATLRPSQWRALQAGLALHREQRPATIEAFIEGLLSMPAEPPESLIVAA